MKTYSNSENLTDKHNAVTDLTQSEQYATKSDF